MAKANPKERIAFILYMETDMTQKEIAAELDTTEQTLSKWSIKGDWHNKKAVDTLSPDKLVRMYYSLSFDIEKMIKDEGRTATIGEADSLVKLASAIEKLDKKVNASIVIAVFMRFVNTYLKLVDPELAKKISPHQLKYVETLTNPEK